MNNGFLNDRRGDVTRDTAAIPSTPTPPPPSVISNQLRDELIRILQAGDAKHGGAFTVAVAAQIEKFIAAAREILMTEQLAHTDLASLMLMRRSPGGAFPYSVYNGGLVETGMPLTSITNNENFGVQAIRQVVDAIRTMGESPVKLVEALAAARTHQLHDVVADLEKKLGVATSATSAASAVGVMAEDSP